MLETCIPFGNQEICRRYVTADAIGWLKWGNNAQTTGAPDGSRYEAHGEVPRFGALRRDKTPTPAYLNYRHICVHGCSLSCICVVSELNYARAKLDYVWGWMKWRDLNLLHRELPCPLYRWWQGAHEGGDTRKKTKVSTSDLMG